MIKYPHLHDSTLSRIEVAWASKTICIFFVDGRQKEIVVEAKNVSKFAFANNAPWGPSDSINYVGLENGSRLIIEMQAGDVLEIEATVFKLPIEL